MRRTRDRPQRRHRVRRRDSAGDCADAGATTASGIGSEERKVDALGPKSSEPEVAKDLDHDPARDELSNGRTVCISIGPDLENREVVSNKSQAGIDASGR